MESVGTHLADLQSGLKMNTGELSKAAHKPKRAQGVLNSGGGGGGGSSSGSTGSVLAVLSLSGGNFVHRRHYNYLKQII